MAPRASTPRSLFLSLGLLLAGGCEAIADFDPKKLDQDRTVGPTPLPSVDGAVPNVPDAGSGQDAALIQPEPSDAQVGDGGGTDANVPQDGAVRTDANVPDAASDAGNQADSGNEDAGADDISFADAGP